MQIRCGFFSFYSVMRIFFVAILNAKFTPDAASLLRVLIISRHFAFKMYTRIHVSYVRFFGLQDNVTDSLFH